MKPTFATPQVKFFLAGSLLAALGLQSSPYFYKQVLAPHKLIEYSQDLASMSKEDFISKVEKKIKVELSDSSTSGGIRSPNRHYVKTLNGMLKIMKDSFKDNDEFTKKEVDAFIAESESGKEITEKKLEKTKEDFKITDSSDVKKLNDSDKETYERVEQTHEATQFFVSALKETSREFTEAASACDTAECKEKAEKNKALAEISRKLKDLEEQNKELKSKIAKEDKKEEKDSDDDLSENKKRTEAILAKVEKNCRSDEDYKHTVCLAEELLDAMENNTDDKRMDLKLVEKFFEKNLSEELKELLSIGLAERREDLYFSQSDAGMYMKDFQMKRRMVESGQKLLKKLVRSIPKEYLKIKREVVEIASESQADDLMALSQTYLNSKALEKSNPGESLNLLDVAQRSQLALNGQLQRVNTSLREGLMAGIKDGNHSRNIFTQLYRDEFLNEVNPYIQSITNNPFKAIVVNENGQVLGTTQVANNGLVPLSVNADGTIVNNSNQVLTFRAGRSGSPGLNGQLTQQKGAVTINGKQYVEVNSGNVRTGDHIVPNMNATIGTSGTRHGGATRGSRSQ